MLKKKIEKTLKSNNKSRNFNASNNFKTNDYLTFFSHYCFRRRNYMGSKKNLNAQMIVDILAEIN